MSDTTPWDDISTPNLDFNVRLVSESKRIPIYWGKNPTGDCILIIELEGDFTKQFLKNTLTIHGVHVDLRLGNKPTFQRLILTLDKHVDRDLFFGLCGTLISSLATIADSNTAFEISLNHIKRWKAFLAGRKANILTPEEIRGLFAELHFLRLLYQDRMPQLEAIKSWCGPDGSHQDFIFDDTAVEIKSLSGRERNTVRISSEDQLEGLTTHLFLVIYKLSETSDPSHSISLNQLVSKVEQELIESESIELFSHKLTSYGYSPLIHYDTPRLIISRAEVFRVADGFPRLIRSLLPIGITHLSYDIELETLSPFACELIEILEGT